MLVRKNLLDKYHIKKFKYIFLSIFGIFVGLILLLYGLLNMPLVQNYVKDLVVKELKSKLKTNLGIESLSIQPFNTIQLNGVYLNDQEDSTILKANKVYAEFDLMPLLNKQLVISSAKLSDFDVYLSKDSAKAPLNIQFIVDAFKPTNNSKNTKLDVRINSVNIADGHFCFDVHDKPIINDKFDANHIDVSNLNAKLALKCLQPDSLNIQIKKLELKEKSGLVINNLITRILTKDKHLYIKGFNLFLPKSLVKFDKCEVDYTRFLTPADLLNNATFDTEINSSYIALRDISAFVPAFKHFEDRILFKTKISGKLDSIRVSNITLDYGDRLHLSAQGFVTNIRNKDKTFIRASLDDLSIGETDISTIINNLSNEKKSIPPTLSNLGPLTFKGCVSGYLKEMKADGDLHSSMGTITANAIVGIEPDEYNRLTFRGRVVTKNFELGKLLNNNDIGEISLDVTADIAQPQSGKLNGSVHGIIQDFTFKNYSYSDISIEGNYDGLKLDGSIALEDPNGILKINGLFDLTNKNEPVLDFNARIKNVRLDNLNLSQKYKEAYIGANIYANFKGKNIDDIEGYIKADSISFLQSGNSLKMNKFIIQASKSDNNRILSVESDLINGEVTGQYSFSTIIESLKKTFHNYLPVLIPINNKQSSLKENNLNFDFTINNTENASEIFKLPVVLYSPSRIVGFYDNKTEKFKLEAFLPSLNAGGSKIQSGYLKLENTDQEIKSLISGSFVTKNSTINDLTIDINTQNNKIDIHTLLLNKDQTRLKIELSNSILFSKSDDKKLQTNINFKAGELILNSVSWHLPDSEIQIKDSKIDVNNFVVTSSDNTQRLSIDGSYSPKNENNILNVKLESIDLSYIFNTLNISALQFGGFANGSLAVSSIKGKPYADVNLNVEGFEFNNTRLGNLELFSDLEAENQKVTLKGKITNENQKLTNIDGFINPINQELSINFDAEDVDVAFLNKYVSTLFNGIKGRGTGKVHLLGNFSNVTVEGKAFIKDGSVGINFLNTAYSFTDTIFMKKDLIYFSNVAFHDEKGNEAKISGKVVHDYFSNFMYYVDLKGSKFLLYNATEKLNPLFYGTIYGSGSGVIKGDEKNVDINMNLRTDSNTNVFMNFMESTATEYSFITYKTKEEKTDSITEGKKPKLSRFKTDSGIEMNMNFYIDATPDATIDILMDPIGGDRLRGSGSGALQFVWGTNKDPMLYGTYQINKGSYNFTFQKLLERKFSIQDGSYIQFRGDPFQANLDITALYRITANLNDLDRNIAQISGQTNIPVNCLLNLVGPLRRPNVKLDIELPSADPEIQRQVKTLMSTEDMINRQIVYLLLLSKFYTPNYAVTDQKTSDFAAIASATLSAQLSKILSGIDDRWQIGTNIRTSDSEFSNTEVELMLSSRLLNDRVLLNGNFGYKDNLYASDAFIGDIDIEVLLNRMGTWRLKAYNHYNEKFYYVRNAVQTQGVGILYKRDFDNLRELLGISKKDKKSKIKQDTISIKQDTIPSYNQFVKMKK